MEKLCELSQIKNIKILMPTYFIYKQSMGDNMNDCEILNRFIALDEHIKKNNFGFRIYDQIQKYRKKKKKEIPNKQYDNVNNFKRLIKSIQKNGYIDLYPIVLNKNYAVVDGAHRLSVALYLGIKEVPVIFPENAYDFNFDYSINWLKANGFGQYIDLLLEQHNRIKTMYEDSNV